MLRIKPDTSTNECREVDAVAFALELKLDSVMTISDREHAIARTRLVEHAYCCVLEDSGTNRGLDIGATAAVDHDGIDASLGQQVRQ
jgi:hypothetical protein